MPVTDKISSAAAPLVVEIASRQEPPRPAEAKSRSAEDGTLMLLRTGFWITLGGLLALLATETLFGGIGIHGATTNAGWLALMFALMSVPFGLMLLVLGGAKWFRNRSSANPEL